MKLDWLTPRSSAMLGLLLDGPRLEGVVLRRSKGGLQIDRAFETSLSLDLLTNDPELVGREIRNHLDEAGIRETRCAVGVPLNWALTLQVKLPDLPEADIAAFLGVQAERGFPYGPEDLVIATSQYRTPSGERYATLVAIPRNHVQVLDKALAAARLKPVSFTLAITSLPTGAAETGSSLLTLALGEKSVDVQVTCGGGVAALRALHGALETEGNQRRIDADLLIRELRLTLGQLPSELRESVGQVRLFGPADLTKATLEELAPVVQPMGLRLAIGSLPEAAITVPSKPASSLALALAARQLAGSLVAFEFLPPRISAWTQISSRFSSGRVLWSSVSAGAGALLVGGLFLFQFWQLSHLESQWRSISPRVTDLTTMQQNIRKFRPWFDDSIKSLTILTNLTAAFPQEGFVSAKTLEVKNLTEVSCSGAATDNTSLLKVLERLGAVTKVSDLKVQQIRGRSPILFTFDFRWTEEAAHEN